MGITKEEITTWDDYKETNMTTDKLPNIRIESSYPTMEERKLFLEREAQRMRDNPTDGEKLFKSFCDRYGIAYTNQKPVIIGYKGFILDFEIITDGNPRGKGKSKKRKIVVEIDGGYHATEEQKAKDAERSKTLRGHMYHVIRFTNDEVKDDATIIRKFQEFLPKIKETTLLKKLSEAKAADYTYTVKLIHEKAYLHINYNSLKKEYESLKRKYEELKEWALQVKSMTGNIANSCPAEDNVVDFF